ncbi:MAG: fimbria/pilus outer membrane usher protein [Syntrophorhabdaceae bacterium]
MSRRLSACVNRILFIFFFLALFPNISTSQLVTDNDQIIVNIKINEENKGDIIAYLTPQGDFLIGLLELKELGFVDPKGALSIIQQKQYISLSSMPGISFVFNENKLSLAISADPELLANQVFDLKTYRSPRAFYPKDNSAFLNYGFTRYSDLYSANESTLNVSNELGVRLHDILFLSESTYTRNSLEDNFVRLQSSAVYDFRNDLRRLTAGDFFASSGDLGSNINMGGLSYSKLYSMNPYFVKQPLFNFSGQTSLPSEANIYVDGVLIRREKLSPGSFELQNIQYYGGYRNVDVVIKDVFGREQTIQNPFFFNDILLKKGLNEYSYNVGFLRRNYGVKSNDYTDPAFSFFHRYGLTDQLTLGVRGEGLRGESVNFGPTVSFLEKNIGILTASLSRGAGNYSGWAGYFSHNYQNKYISTQFYIQSNSRDYRTLASQDYTDVPRYLVSAGLGYSITELGSLSLNYTQIKKYVGLDTETYGAAYQRQITDKLQLSLSFTHSNQNQYGDYFNIRFTWYPGKDITVALSHDRDDKTDSTALQVQKNPPIGEGYGYRLTAVNSNSPDSSRSYVNPFVQVNGKYGIYSAEYRGQYEGSGNTESYQVTASGAIVYVGNTVGLTRPVYDSFGLVKVADLKGIEVLQNNQVVGKTNGAGKVLIPSMNSFSDNYLSINDKTLPLNYTAHYINREVSPPFRSGSVIPFEVTKIQGITGTLNVRTKDAVLPVEFEEIRVSQNGRPLTVPTGRGGEFYLENMAPGKYPATSKYMEKKLFFDIIIPANDETIIDLGKVIGEYGP